MVTFNQSETNLRQLITHDLCSVITDGFYVKGRPHPRLHGTYPELLGKLVRDLAWLSLPQAIHKSTAQPAARLNLRDHGLVKKGYFADLVIFDPDSIQSKSSYTDPAADPQGVVYVIENGEIVLRGRQPGRSSQSQF
jgi:N-acyl-D-aspartate/D-glutamate deacylase